MRWWISYITDDFNWLKKHYFCCKSEQKVLKISQLKFFVCIYKIVDISAEIWNKTGVSVIKAHENDDVNKTLLLLLCISHIGKRWGGKNLYDQIDTEVKGKHNVKKMNDLTKQQIRKCKIDRWKLIKNRKESMYVSEIIAIPIIMQSTISNPKAIKFRSNLVFNQINLILIKKQ